MRIKEYIDNMSDNPNIINIFAYGSFVYHTNNKKSDYDYICIISTETDTLKNQGQIKFDDGDITFYTEDYFKQLLYNHEISAIECLFETTYVANVDKQFEYIKYFEEVFDKSKLRTSLSSKASNSWVKCKKKLTVEKDFNFRIGIKSLFHSIRILCYGWQIATSGKIYDFAMCNNIWDEIKQYNEDTEYRILKEKFQPIYNEWHHKFVIVAPK